MQAVHDAATAVPALIRVQYDWRAPLFRVGNKYIHLAPDTMSFSDIITLIFINNRYMVLEYPISINPRIHGKSTISVETAFQTIMEIINIVILFNPMKLSDDNDQIMFCGLWYDDEFIRTADGWRMTRRGETKCIQKFV